MTLKYVHCGRVVDWNHVVPKRKKRRGFVNTISIRGKDYIGQLRNYEHSKRGHTP
jgi:hypothetical protein